MIRELYSKQVYHVCDWWKMEKVGWEEVRGGVSGEKHEDLQERNNKEMKHKSDEIPEMKQRIIHHNRVIGPNPV